MEAAQFSIPFGLGGLAIRGTQAFVPRTDLTLVNAPEIISVASRVQVAIDAEMTQSPPAVPSRITITTRDDTFTETVVAARRTNQPARMDDLFQEFHDLATRSAVSSRQEADLRDALKQMRLGNFEPLLTELAHPVAPAGEHATE